VTGHEHEHTHDVAGAPAAALRSHGLRATEPRLRVLAAMTGRDHLTAEALHRLVAEDGGAPVALTTVYRTLESLERAGLVWATVVPDVGRTFHVGTHAPHAHALCRVCGALADLAPLAGEPWSAGVPDGFAVEHVQVTVTGVCASCGAATS
jgi:Fur family ferric uptake transcriptional regulator